MTYIPNTQGTVSSVNSTGPGSILGANAIFTGTSVVVSAYSQVNVYVSSNQNSATNGLAFQFSADNATWNYNSVYPIFAAIPFTMTVPVAANNFRVVYTNGTVATDTSFQLQTILQPFSNAVTIQSRLPNNVITDISCTTSENLRVAVQEPNTAFGEMTTAQNTTYFQGDYVYGINSLLYYVSTPNVTGAGSVTASNSLALVATSATQNNYACLQTLRSMRYRAGQGSICRFSAIFQNTTGTASGVGYAGNDQLIGMGNWLSGLYFGYQDTTFGLLRLAGGTLGVQTLTVTLVLGTGTATITLRDGGTARVFSAPYAGGSSAAIATSILNTPFDTLYPGWQATANGAVITFICRIAQLNDTALTSTIGTGVVVVNGAAPTPAETEFIPQTAWNIDVMNGTKNANNPSGVLLNPAVGNVYQIQMQYLGFGALTFFVENPNTGRLEPVHRFNYANNFSVTNVKIPNYFMQVLCRNRQPLTPQAVTLRTASNYGAVQGAVPNLGPVHAISFNNLATYRNTSQFLFAIQGSAAFNNLINTVPIIPVSFSIIYITNVVSGLLSIYKCIQGVSATFSATATSTTNWSSASIITPTNTSNALVQIPTTVNNAKPTNLGALVGSYYLLRNISLTVNLDILNIDQLPSLECLIFVVQFSGNVVANELRFTFNWQEEY